jgi:AcrR family transcriptional regulator
MGQAGSVMPEPNIRRRGGVNEKQPEETGQPAPLGRRERKKALVRKQLYETAMDLFHRQGFAETTIEQITERVDVAPATFFNYFPSKDAVLADYHRETVEQLLAYVTELSGGALERFTALFDYVETRAETEGRKYRVLVQEFLARPAILESSNDLAMRTMQLLMRWVDEGKAAGEIRKDPDSMLVVRTVMHIWNAAALEWAMGPEEAACLTMQQEVELLFDGLAP